MKRLLLFFGLLVSPLWSQAPFTPRPWDSYRTILWMGDSTWKDPSKEALVWQRLEELGINTGMVTGDEKADRFVKKNMPYYVENMVSKGLCLKWNSKVKDWNAFVTEWTKTGRKKDAMVREYCFDDPAYLSWARGRMKECVTAQVKNNPVLYDIRDELATTISANPFDYDFHPLALTGFRNWLKQSYGTVEKLNAQWETKFASWDAVVPFTTDEIKNRHSGGGALPRGNPDWQALAATKFDPATAVKDRTRWNFAPWCDHRTYMDQSLAKVLGELRETAHQLDPKTPVGIEGTQMPSAFGGYDLWKMSQVLDWIEPYDIANSREIFGSFMPGKTFLTTVGDKNGNMAGRRLWHLLLEGDRGCIVWWSEDCVDWGKADYPLTERGKAMSVVLKEMTSSLASLWLKAKRVTDDVEILYSQPSLQVGWMLESTVDGSTWVRRFSSYESQVNKMAQVRDGWCKAVQDLGYSARFVSTEQLTTTWKPKPNGVLILPQCIALSDAEVAAIKTAEKAGMRVLMNPNTGAFDDHGSLKAEAPFAGQGISAEDTAAYTKARMAGSGAAFRNQVKASFKNAPSVEFPAEKGLRVYRHTLGKAQLISLERGIAYSMSESLAQAGGNETMETPLDVEVKVPAGFCYDLRTGKLLGKEKLKLTINPWRPTLLAVLDHESPDVLKELLK